MGRSGGAPRVRSRLSPPRRRRARRRAQSKSDRNGRLRAVDQQSQMEGRPWQRIAFKADDGSGKRLGSECFAARRCRQASARRMRRQDFRPAVGARAVGNRHNSREMRLRRGGTLAPPDICARKRRIRAIRPRYASSGAGLRPAVRRHHHEETPMTGGARGQCAESWRRSTPRKVRRFKGTASLDRRAGEGVRRRHGLFQHPHGGTQTRRDSRADDDGEARLRPATPSSTGRRHCEAMTDSRMPRSWP